MNRNFMHTSGAHISSTFSGLDLFNQIDRKVDYYLHKPQKVQFE
jgi:hypothetical protein